MKDRKVFFMYIGKHSKKFHVSQRGNVPGGAIVIIALLKISKQSEAKLIRYTYKLQIYCNSVFQTDKQH